MGESRLDSVRRFDDRVDDYAKYRPDYPNDIVVHLRSVAGLRTPARIADVGAGTGKLSAVFLAAGDAVFGVEPNATMRAAAQRELAAYPRYRGIAGRAEALPIAPASVDAVTAGQAFHWFDADCARSEFARALKPGGLVALVWNNRKESMDGFLADYEDMLRRLCPDYERVGNKHYEEARLTRFFGAPPSVARFDHAQRFDCQGLRGRLLSSSYVPASGPARDTVLAESDAIFARYARDGEVVMPYDTMLFHGTLV